MGKMIQIRNVPESIHRVIKARAAMDGLSLSDYLLREIRKLAAKPTGEELRRRIESREPAPAALSPARAVREERDRR